MLGNTNVCLQVLSHYFSTVDFDLRWFDGFSGQFGGSCLEDAERKTVWWFVGI